MRLINGFEGMEDLARLDAEQRRLASLSPEPWVPSAGRTVVAGGVFVAFGRGEQGPGQAGDRAHVGAAATSGTDELARVVVDGRAPAPYAPGYLAAREGALVESAARRLLDEMAIDVLLVDATGRDHPRGAGLALHLGAVLDIPTIGVTHRPLLAVGSEPGDELGATSDLSVDATVVARWLRTRRGARPVVVHAAWRTGVQVATEVVLSLAGEARTPEPLRLARMAAREARAGRTMSVGCAGSPMRHDQAHYHRGSLWPVRRAR